MFTTELLYYYYTLDSSLTLTYQNTIKFSDVFLTEQESVNDQLSLVLITNEE